MEVLDLISQISAKVKPILELLIVIGGIIAAIKKYLSLFNLGKRISNT